MEKKELASAPTGERASTIVLTAEDRERLIERPMRDAARKREAREEETRRRRGMAISLETGEKCACSGEISYSSTQKFVQTGPIVFGGRTPGRWEEERTASCGSCGLLYQAGHPRFSDARAQVAEMRKPPDADWEPPAQEER